MPRPHIKLSQPTQTLAVVEEGNLILSDAPSWSVYSGRDQLGTIELVDEVFIATDVDGVTIGEFSTLRDASRTFWEPTP